MNRDFLPLAAVCWLVGATLTVLPATVASADPFPKLSESAPETAKRWAVVFDFDGDGCYPSSAVSPAGKVNPGLATRGALNGNCHDAPQLDESNTYYRTVNVQKDGKTYAVHMYALYFAKDQVAPGPFGGGHTHDWEFALVWTRDGELTHSSTSAHGKVQTLERAKLPFDPKRPDHVKVVYHKDGVATHAFRFAKPNEKPENHKNEWLTPTLVDWDTMKGDDKTPNAKLRDILNKHNFGGANCSVNDKNFPEEIAKNTPPGYPPGDEWKKAVKK